MTAKYFKYDEEYNLIPIYNDDVVEVVRCKDCKFATVHYGDLVCRKEKPCLFRELEDYCSYGERRETE